MRKRIAALLAVAMVAALMPMTAFAASTNRLTRDVAQVEENGSAENELKIEVKDEFGSNKEFYVELEGAEWDTMPTTAPGVKLDADGSTLKVTRTTDDLDGENKDTITIPVNAKKIVGDDDGKAYVVVDSWGTTVTSSKHLFATVVGTKAKVKVGDAPTFYTEDSKTATFTIEEVTANQLRKAGKLEFTLDHDDYEFVGGDEVKLVRTLGADSTIKTVVGKDKQVATVDFSTLNSKNIRGIAEVTLKVRSTTRRPETGDLNIEVSGDAVESKSYKVATIAEYGVTLKADKEYEFLAGRTEEVKFSLKEVVDDSIAKGRTTEFTLSEDVYFNSLPGTINDKTVEPLKDKDGRIYGFHAVVDEDADFKLKLDIPANFEGDVILSTDGRAFEDLELKLATVKPAIKVTVEPMTVKVGLKEQVGGKIIIEELEKGALNKGKDILVNLEKDTGMSLIGKPAVKVTEGDLRLDDTAVTTGEAIRIPVKRASKEASTIEITDVKVRLDRTVPEGAYDVKVGGGAISTLAGTKLYGNDNILAKDFIFVGERYTRPVTVFTIGSNTFTVNGEPRVMDASAYLKEGRTMVPVRYLAYALGISEEAIKYNAGVVTIIDDSKVIQVTRGSNELVVNGMVIPMETSAENSKEDGRAYVPFKDIGAVFGVTGHWDPVTQTATFK